MPLLFIVIFLASFLTGSSAGYLAQQGQENQTPGVTSTPANVTTTPGPLACAPTLDKDNVITGSEIVIEARAFIKNNPQSQGEAQECKDSEIGENRYCCNDQSLDGKNYACDVRQFEKVSCDDKGEHCTFSYKDWDGALVKRSYQSILDHLFGKDAKIEGTFNPNRKDHNWVLIKKDAYLPSWKVAFSSGTSLWSLPIRWWDNTRSDTDTDQQVVIFREMTRIGYVNPAPTNTWTTARYGGNLNGAGDVWIGTGWCPKGKEANDQISGPAVQAVCNDPLVRNVLLVVHIKGRGPQSGRGWGDKGPRESRDFDSEDKPISENWWAFDIYYDQKTLLDNAANFARPTGYPAGPSKEDLPCWMRSGCETRDPGDENRPGPGGYRMNPEWDKPCWKINPTPILTPGAYLLPKQGSPLSLINNFQKKIKALFSSLTKQVFAQTSFPQFVSGKAIDFATTLTAEQKTTLSANTYIKDTSVSSIPAGSIKCGSLKGADDTPYQAVVSSDFSQLFLQSNGTTRYNLVHKEASQGQNLKLNDFSSVSSPTPSLLSPFPQFVSGKAIDFVTTLTSEQKKALLANTYIMDKTITSLPPPPVSIVAGILEGISGPINVSVSSDFKQLFLQLGTTIVQYNLVHSENTQGENLKLDTFAPPIAQPTTSVPASFRYEWYTPACKPAIYLYPQKETNLSVYVFPQGKLTESIPLYNQGWNNVLAKPNGEILYNNTTYPYLYYEAEIKNVTPPKQGWVIKKEDLSTFFGTILPYLGLNTQESQDFKDYWLKKLTTKPYYFIGLIERNILDQLETINFTTLPDTFIRVRFYFTGLDKPIITTTPLLPKTPQRSGFTAVDWGGMIDGGSCSTESVQIVQ